MVTYKLIVGQHEWLYDGPRAVKRAKAVARLLLRRYSLTTAYIIPYGGVQGETIIVNR